MSYTQRRRKGDYWQVPEGPGIYRLYHGDAIVYVGESDNLRRRLIQHEEETFSWGSYDYKRASSNRKKRLEEERRAIIANQPTRNIKHNY